MEIIFEFLENKRTTNLQKMFRNLINSWFKGVKTEKKVITGSDENNLVSKRPKPYEIKTDI
jgi:hypothetical protein